MTFKITKLSDWLRAHLCQTHWGQSQSAPVNHWPAIFLEKENVELQAGVTWRHVYSGLCHNMNSCLCNAVTESSLSSNNYLQQSSSHSCSKAPDRELRDRCSFNQWGVRLRSLLPSRTLPESPFEILHTAGLPELVCPWSACSRGGRSYTYLDFS